MIFLNKDGTPILHAMIEAIQKNKDYLSEIDGQIGDGDHGVNMNKGFSIFAKWLEKNPVGFSEGLSHLGEVLMSEIGGSMGSIYGTLFMGMAEALEGRQQIDQQAFPHMLQAAREGVFEIVDARKGDKTLVDTLEPAIEAFEKATADGQGFADALRSMTEAAEKGSSSTKELEAKYGRSARLGPRSIGVLDAGAVSCYLLLTAMREGVQQLLHERQDAL